MASVEEILKAQRSEGPATVLAIGTANPPNCISQADFPDYYFRVTKNENLTELKKKFQRMCKFRNICMNRSLLCLYTCMPPYITATTNCNISYISFV